MSAQPRRHLRRSVAGTSGAGEKYRSKDTRDDEMLMKLDEVVAIEEALGSAAGYGYEQARGDVSALLEDNDALRQELAKAYRCIRGMYGAYAHGVLPGDTMMGYHSLTIGAAVRYVETQHLEGTCWFVGKHVEELQEVLRSVRVQDVEQS